VRDNYAVGDDRILMVASDRISAFDVIMGEPIPGKGALLTQMALFWFDKLKDIVPNHLTGEAPESAWSPTSVAQVRAARCWSSASSPCRWRPWCAATWPAAAGRNTRTTSSLRRASCPPV
jgi:hypothetical protein